MFAPFARGQATQGAEGSGSPDKDAKPAGSAPGGDIDDLKRQMEEMQKRLDRLGDKDK